MSSVNNNLLYFSQTQGYYYFLPLGTQFLRVKYQRLTTMYMHLFTTKKPHKIKTNYIDRSNSRSIETSRSR